MAGGEEFRNRPPVGCYCFLSLKCTTGLLSEGCSSCWNRWPLCPHGSWLCQGEIAVTNTPAAQPPESPLKIRSTNPDYIYNHNQFESPIITCLFEMSKGVDWFLAPKLLWPGSRRSRDTLASGWWSNWTSCFAPRRGKNHFWEFGDQLPSLKLTVRTSHLKILFGMAFWQVRTVKFREGKFCAVFAGFPAYPGYVLFVVMEVESLVGNTPHHS